MNKNSAGNYFPALLYTKFCLFFYSSTLVFLISSRTLKIMDGDTDSSSNPIFKKVDVSVVSAPSSPQMPTQHPCL